jgi:zeta-carotene desaturase
MFGGGPKDAALGLPICPLDELYAAPSRRFIESRRGDVRVGCPARVHLQHGRVAYLEARGERLTPGAVVVAVPWYALSDVFAGDTAPVDTLRKAAAHTHASPIASVNLWLDRRVMQTPFLGLPGRTMQWVFDKSQMFQGESSHLTMVSSGADSAMTVQNDELIALALRELREALPDVRAAKVSRASVVRERRATFSIAPGQPARPATVTEIPGLVLAGDWVDTGLPATIESAAVSGRRAAEALS